MPCEWYEKDGVVIHVNRGRGRGPRRTCQFCHQSYYGGKLCDFPIGDGRTCDAEMCDKCARTVGGQNSDIGQGFKRLADTIDVCPNHGGYAIIRQGGKVRFEQPTAEPKAPLVQESPCTFHTEQGNLPFEASQPDRGDHETE